jgi:hypothetical protein
MRGVATAAVAAAALIAALLLLKVHRKATHRQLSIASAAASVAARNCAAITIQSVQRRRLVSLLCGPRQQLCVHSRTEFKVCTSLSCMRNGAERVLSAIEDLVPPALGAVYGGECFGMCGAGPNVAVSSANGTKLRCSIQSVNDARRLVAASGLHVSASLGRAARLHERANQLVADGERIRGVETAEQALVALDALPSGSVTVLRLRYRICLLLADAAASLIEEPPKESQSAKEPAAFAQWEACALRASTNALALHERLARAHAVQGVNLHRMLPRVALVLHEVVAIHGRGRALERTRGALRPVVDVDANASSGRHVGAGHLEAVELTGRLEDCSDQSGRDARARGVTRRPGSRAAAARRIHLRTCV